MTVTTPAPTTELEAVNTMLQSVGASPVSDVTISADIDVTNAVAILRETNREIQSQGWDFNTDERYSMARTVDGYYVVPSNVLSIDVSEDFPTVNAVFRNGKLWDKDNHTFVWDKDLTFDITWLFPFEELPQHARNYIALAAARKFQARTLGSSTLAGFTQADEDKAKAIFVDAEALEADHNILTGNYSVYRVLKRWV